MRKKRIRQKCIPNNLSSNNPYHEILAGYLVPTGKEGVINESDEAPRKADSYSKLVVGDITTSSFYEESEAELDGNNRGLVPMKYFLSRHRQMI